MGAAISAASGKGGGPLMDTDSILDDAVVLSRAPHCEEYDAIVRATGAGGSSAAAAAGGAGDQCATKLASVFLSAYAKSYYVEDEAAHSVRGLLLAFGFGGQLCTCAAVVCDADASRRRQGRACLWGALND